MTPLHVTAPTISEAWLDAVRGISDMPQQRALHTFVSIADPTAEVARIRAAADALLESLELPSVETVANTIFPAALNDPRGSHRELADRYLAIYPTIRERLPVNQKGTYFQRLIAYPAPGDGAFDQVAATISRVLAERDERGPKTARYEIGIATAADFAESTMGPADHAAHAGGGESAVDESVPFSLPSAIYVPGRDNSPMAFPCLSHCSFQLDRDGRLHALALYRSQFMVQRAYGNYLGLGRLLTHIAHHAGVGVGTLGVVAGYAQIDAAGKIRVRRLLQSAAQPA